MYAIVEIAGRQFRAEVGKKIYVNRLDAIEGESISFEKVLLTDDNGLVSIGTPTLSTVVKAKVLAHLKDDKVLIFKKKRRKGYQKLNGHRQSLTQIQIEAIA